MIYLSEQIINFIITNKELMVRIIDFMFLHLVFCMLLPAISSVCGFILLTYYGRFMVVGDTKHSDWFGTKVLLRRVFTVYVDYCILFAQFTTIMLVSQHNYEEYVKLRFFGKEEVGKTLIRLSRKRGQ